MAKIIIIEDTETIREELKTFLSKYVFDGYYICREIRKSSDVPIIVVTSRDSEVDELMSMNLGADDFITKPYNTQVLLARIISILRRVQGISKQIYVAGKNII